MHRKLLIGMWLALSLAAYYLYLMTSWGNYYHGGNAISKSIENATGVFAAFASLEVFRTERTKPLRIAAILVGAPLVLAISLKLWFGIKHYFS